MSCPFWAVFGVSDLLHVKAHQGDHQKAVMVVKTCLLFGTKTAQKTESVKVMNILKPISFKESKNNITALL